MMIMMFRHSRSPPIQLLLPVLGVLLQLVHSSPVTSPSGLNDGTVAGVRSNMLQVANARYAHPLNSNKIKSTFSSWELGTATEALIELEWPFLSVFNKSAFPPPTVLSSADNANDVLRIAIQTVSMKPYTSMALVAGDNATGDPASEYLGCPYIYIVILMR